MPAPRSPGEGQDAAGRADGKTIAFAEERHARILQVLGERGRVRNSELAGLLAVTEPTIRKDVADLARQQLLHRTHGGAMAVRPAFEPDLPARVIRNTEAKTKIARACLELVADGDAVFLDGGSTVLRIAELLGETSATMPARNVNVLTNALGVAQALASQAGIRHTVLGGTYRPAGGCFVGPLTLADLENFTVNVAFIGVTGLSGAGLTVADLNEAQIKRAVIDRARRAVVVMDHSKLGAADFARVCALDAVDVLVTDEHSDYLAGVCRAAGVDLVTATA
jgi:DeoR/GlpR family transcriptional regulator of sugar metabolism